MHAYQGASDAVRSGVIGAVLTLIVAMAGSLVPAIALHALVDVGSGVITWLALREGPGKEDGPGTAAPASTDLGRGPDPLAGEQPP